MFKASPPSLVLITQLLIILEGGFLKAQACGFMCLQIGNVCYCCSEAYGAICGAICEGMSFLFMNNPFSVSRLFFGPFLSFLREQNEQKKANKNAHLHYMPSSTSEL